MIAVDNLVEWVKRWGSRVRTFLKPHKVDENDDSPFPIHKRSADDLTTTSEFPTVSLIYREIRKTP